MGNGTFTTKPRSKIPLSTCGTTTCRADLGSCKSAEETQHHWPFFLHSHTTGATVTRSQDRMTKGRKRLAEAQTQAAEMRCYSAKRSGLEKVPATSLSFIPKRAHALQPSTLGPGRGTACDVCDTQPHCWQEMKSFVLLDVNSRPSANPEAIRL